MTTENKSEKYDKCESRMERVRVIAQGLSEHVDGKSVTEVCEGFALYIEAQMEGHENPRLTRAIARMFMRLSKHLRNMADTFEDAEDEDDEDDALEGMPEALTGLLKGAAKQIAAALQAERKQGELPDFIKKILAGKPGNDGEQEVAHHVVQALVARDGTVEFESLDGKPLDPRKLKDLAGIGEVLKNLSKKSDDGDAPTDKTPIH